MNEYRFQVNDQIIWRNEIEKNSDIENIAQCFRLAYYGDKTLNIEGEWAGFLFAPNAKVILGQTKYKEIYGQILGKGISVHQHSTITRIVFNPLKPSYYSLRSYK